MLELAVSLTLLGVVLLALNRFVLGGLSASATNIEMADLRRQVAYTQQLLRADLEQARACDSTGYGPPLLRLDGESPVRRLAVYTTATADGSGQLVEWRFYPDGRILRMSTVREGGDLCDAGIPIPVGALIDLEQAGDGFDTVLDEQHPVEVLTTARNVSNVRLFGTYSYLDEDGRAAVETRGTWTGMCVGPAQAQCYVDQITLEFTTTTSGGEPVVVPFFWTLAVDLSNARM